MQFENVVIGKRADPEKRARGDELEYLAFGMGGEQGPTAWRQTERPLARAGAANAQAELMREIIREIRNPLRRANKKRLRRLMDNYQVAEGMGG